MPWTPATGRQISLIAESVTGRFPIKLSASLIRAGSRQPVPLWGTRRYFNVPASKAHTLAGRVIGPTCLKMEIRQLSPNAGQQSAITISATHLTSAESIQETVHLPTQSDETYASVVTGASVSLPAEVIIPLTQKGVYYLTATSDVRSVPGAIARCYAIAPPEIGTARPNGCNDIFEQQIEIDVEASAAPADLTPADFTPANPTMPEPAHWKTSDNIPYRYEFHSGTWITRLGYRHRHRNSDPESDDAIYGGDGIGVSLGREKRFDVSDSSRIFTDVTLGATRSSDENKNLLGYLSHHANWHFPESDYRLRWSLFAATQTTESESSWRMFVQGDLRRTIKLTPIIALTGAIGGFAAQQSIKFNEAQ
jgi:hypothetical protein